MENPLIRYYQNIANSFLNQAQTGSMEDVWNNSSSDSQDRDDSSDLNQLSSNKLSKPISKDQQSATLAVQSKRRYNRKKKCLVQNRVQGALNPKSTVPICSGLYISDDGVIRFCYSISQVCFGYQAGQTINVKENKISNMVEITIQQFLKWQECSVDEALKHVSYIPNQKFHQLAEKMVIFKNIQETLKEQVAQLKITQEIQDQKDKEYIEFKQKCFETLDEYNKTHPDQMYQYAIGRYNYKKEDFEFSFIGFSQQYLGLIGIDASIFTNMLLRHQRVDLLQSREDILDLSLLGLISITSFSQNDRYECYIKTFDGFPIKIIQKKHRIEVPGFQNSFLPNGYDFTLAFTEFDVDVDDLQRLIEYRQKIQQNNNNLSITDFVNKELSYLFEDVEYSIHSQDFLDRYYKENIQYLSQTMMGKIQKKECSYRYIN